MNQPEDFQLEVTVRFEVPVESNLLYEPGEMALHMRETYIQEPDELLQVAADAVRSGDCELTVKPVFYD